MAYNTSVKYFDNNNQWQGLIFTISGEFPYSEVDFTFPTSLANFNVYGMGFTIDPDASGHYLMHIDEVEVEYLDSTGGVYYVGYSYTAPTVQSGFGPVYGGIVSAFSNFQTFGPGSVFSYDNITFYSDSYNCSISFYMLYQGATDEAYQTGYLDGQKTGYQQGLIDGENNATITSSGLIGPFTLIGQAFASVSPILGSEVIGGLTIGTLLTIPFASIILVSFLRLIRK